MPVLFISSLHRKLASEAKPSDMNEVNCLNGLLFSRVYSEADSFFYLFLFMLNPCASTCGVQYKVAVFVFDNRAYALHGFPLHRKGKIGFVIVFLHAGRNLYDARLHFKFGL